MNKNIILPVLTVLLFLPHPSFAEILGDQRHIESAPKVLPICSSLVATHGYKGTPLAENELDTTSIQSALNACPTGTSLHLIANPYISGAQSAFISGPFIIPTGVSLTIEQNVVLFASRQASLYNISYPGSKHLPNSTYCGQYDQADGKACAPFIIIGSGSGIYGPGTIDGQGGQPILYPTGPSQTYSVATAYASSKTNTAGINAAAALFDTIPSTPQNISTAWSAPNECSSSAMPKGFPSVMSWWDLANCVDVVNNGSVQNNPVLIEAVGAANLTFTGVTLQNSPKPHIAVEKSTNITIWGIYINTPSDYDNYGYARAHNTDGIDLSGVTNATVAHSYINDGDDFIAIGGSAYSGATQNVTVIANRFYGGHGISIGSITQDGVSNVLVKDAIVNGGPNVAALSGIHIKSDPANGGVVTNINYYNICMGNVSFPIWFDTGYKSLSGSHYPSYTDIFMDDVSIFTHNIKNSGYIIFNGANAASPLQITMENVLTDNPAVANDGNKSSNADYHSVNANLTLMGDINFMPQGTKVSVGPTSFMTSTDDPSAVCQERLLEHAPFAISQNPK